MYKRRVLSFKYAFDGIWEAFKEEPNLKFHFLAALVVIFLGVHFQITNGEWITLIIAIGLVISVELTNTALEEVVDSFTQDSHPGAKRAKDVSAGAVLIIALMALSVGVFIFFPYLYPILASL